VIEQRQHAVQRSEEGGDRERRVWSCTKRSPSVSYFVNALKSTIWLRVLITSIEEEDCDALSGWKTSGHYSRIQCLLNFDNRSQSVGW